MTGEDELRHTRNPSATTVYDVLPFKVLLKPFAQLIVRLVKGTRKEDESIPCRRQAQGAHR